MLGEFISPQNRVKLYSFFAITGIKKIAKQQYWQK